MLHTGMKLRQRENEMGKNLIKRNSLIMTCDACPSQWEAETTNGEDVYIRYRWGCLSVTKNFYTDNPEEIFYKDFDEELHGTMSTKTLLNEIPEFFTGNKPTV